MKKLFSIILLIVGLALILYFGYVFIFFSALDSPAVFPFIGEPILFSLIFIVIGLIVFVIGVITVIKIKIKGKKLSLE